MEPTWAIVELMGHNVIAGEISEQVIAGVAMLRVDVPACEEQPAYTKFYSGSAVYGITPTDEQTAARAVNRLHIAPIALYIIAPERQLPAPVPIVRQYVDCPGCGESRVVKDGVVLECANCGNLSYGIGEAIEEEEG